MTVQRQTNPSSSNHSYDQRGALDWLAPRWRRDIAQAPTAWQAETIRRAQQLAAYRPGSYLGRNLSKLYGVSAADLGTTEAERLNQEWYDKHGEYPF